MGQATESSLSHHSSTGPARASSSTTTTSLASVFHGVAPIPSIVVADQKPLSHCLVDALFSPFLLFPSVALFSRLQSGPQVLLSSSRGRRRRRRRRSQRRRSQRRANSDASNPCCPLVHSTRLGIIGQAEQSRGLSSQQQHHQRASWLPGTGALSTRWIFLCFECNTVW